VGDAGQRAQRHDDVAQQALRADIGAEHADGEAGQDAADAAEQEAKNWRP
jgi:hypothetical protein